MDGSRQAVAHANTSPAESFTMTPEGLTRDWRVQDRAARLYEVLDRQAKGRPIAIDSYARLGAKLRDRNGRPASPDTIARLLRNLEETGWVVAQRYAGAAGRVGQYALNRAVPDHPLPEFRSAGLRAVPAPPRSTADGGSAAVRTHTGAVPGPREVLKGEAQTPLPPTPPTAQPQTTPVARPATYVGRCSAHGEHPNPPNCIPCKNARLALQAQPAAATPAQVKCRTHLIEHSPAAECRSCRADRIAGDQPAPLELVPA